MSTITSPRPSNPPTSITSTPTTSRTALRDYYNLKSAAPIDATAPKSPQRDSTSPVFSPKVSELDAPNFDAEAYVKSVFANQGLEGVLRVEGGLINEIKGLDGERKALVYDNYSKLITATDTIRKMRSNMDPLTPTTITLGPVV